MKNIFTGFSRKRILILIALFVILVAVIVLICTLTSQSSTISNDNSRGIVKSIEKFVGVFFNIDHNSYFWRVALNLILRKVAHFLEYMLLGISVYAFMNVLLLELRRSAENSAIFCLFVALVDEFRQNFVIGRSPRIFDVIIDTCGALCGIILVMTVFTVVRKRISQTKSKRIK